MAKTKAEYEALGRADFQNGNKDNEPNGGWQWEAYTKGRNEARVEAQVADKREAEASEPKADITIRRPRPRAQRRVRDVARRMEATVEALATKARLRLMDKLNARSTAKWVPYEPNIRRAATGFQGKSKRS